MTVAWNNFDYSVRISILSIVIITDQAFKTDLMKSNACEMKGGLIRFLLAQAYRAMRG